MGGGASSDSKHLIADPALTEFVYHIMSNSTMKQRGLLSQIELLHFRSRSTMRRFAEKAPLEHKLSMLTRLGVSWTTTFVTSDLNRDEIFKSLDKEYTLDMKSRDIMSALRDGKLFTFGSRSLMLTQMMAEHGSHGQSYVLDYGYLSMQKLFKMAEKEKTEKIKDAEEVYVQMAKLMFHTIASFLNITMIGGVSEIHLRILLILMEYRNSFVTAKTVNGKLGLWRNSNRSTHLLNDMVESGLAYTTKKLPGVVFTGQVAFTISEAGIEKAMAFIKYVRQKMNES